MLDSLPERPLTNDEAERLKQQDQRIVPLSILKGDDSPFVVYTLAFYLNEDDRIHLLGYAEEKGGWVKFESFSEDGWTIEKQESAVQEWVDDRYGDTYEQGVLDEESKTIDLA